MIEITLDGKKVEVREGSMVMDAANKLDVYIPHFCYHKKLSIAANCRMCLVDVEKAPKPLPACATPVTAGMVVHTRSDKAIKAQQGVMEFLLINHPLDCPICDQGGECQLQDLAVGYGGSSSRYTEEKRVVFHKDAGPLVAMEEMSRCIHCTRCVRFGQEIAGVMELGMLNRGEFSEITTFVGKTVDSELSGNMIDICPVGALTSKPFRYTARNWELVRRRSIAPHDSLGSNLIVQVKNERVMRVLPLENEAINECWLSDKDRFSYEGLNSPERLTRPMMKVDGQWHEVEWQDALATVADRLGRVVSEHGGGALGFLASPHSTLEELYLFLRLARGLGSENVDTRLRQTDFRLDGHRAGAPWLGMPITDFASLDRVFVIGSFLRKDQPLLAQRLRQSSKRGAQVFRLGAVSDDWLMNLAGEIIGAPSTWVDLLEGIKAALAGDAGTQADPAARVAAGLKSGQKKAIVLGSAALQHPDAALLYGLASAIAESTGATLAVLPEAANSVGAARVGAVPGPSGLSARSQFEQPREAYVLLNVEPEFDVADPVAAKAALVEADFVVALSTYKHGLDYADVLLPVTPFTETFGSFINLEGRLQSFNGVVRPLGEARPAWKVLRVLGTMCHLPEFEFDTAEAVLAAAVGEARAPGTGCDNALRSRPTDLSRNLKSAPAGQLERIADIPIHFADPIVRRAESLQLTRDARVPTLRVNGGTALKLGVAAGSSVAVEMKGGAAGLTVEIVPGVPDGVAWISAAHPISAGLPHLFGAVGVTKTSEPS